MVQNAPEMLRRQTAEELRNLFVRRVRLGLLALIPFLGVFAVADVFLSRRAVGSLWLLKLGQLGGIVVVLRLLRSEWGRRHAIPMVIAEIAYLYTNIAVGAVVIRDVFLTPICVMGINLVMAAAFPWGVLPQLATAIVGAIVIAGNAILVTGTAAAAFAYPQLAGIVGLTMSVYLTHLFGKYREALLQSEVSAAMAQLGQAMISSLERQVLLSRLCEVTGKVFKCDCSYTLLRDPKDEAFAPIASFGDPVERWEAIRVMRLRWDDLPPPLRRLQVDDVSAVSSLDAGGSLLRARYGLEAALCMALHRGKELAGMHVAGYRKPRGPFSPQEERIARGMAQLASMALENARLVEELEAANRLKSDFVATMSHELRTPLNVIIGYNELLRSGTFGPLRGEQEKALWRIEENARILLELINSTLDISRLEREELPIRVSVVHLRPLVADLIADMKGWREKPKVAVTWNVPENLPALRTDATKVKVILKNLLSNAIKFTARGTVSVIADEAEGGIEVAVSDTGIGIAPEAQSVIFEPFCKADSSVSMHYEGAGLGLYVARRLVEVLGGTIGVESEPGRGSTFRVWLPFVMRKPQRPRVRGLSAEEKLGERAVGH